MELENLRQYLLNKKGTTEELPFGPQALVFKVLGKMFALVAWEANPLRISLKCDPEHALALRAIYKSVSAAYHMNKDHWNTVVFDGNIPENEIFEMIDHSYELVVNKLRKADKETLKNLKS